MGTIPITAGIALWAIAFTAQWVIKKKLQDKALRNAYMWVAWICAVAGGLTATTNIGTTLGISQQGATAVSAVGLLLLAADLKDKRPDWGAFLLAALLPMLIRLAGGPAGFFSTLFGWLGSAFASIFGG